MTTYNKPTRIHIQVRDPKTKHSGTRTVYSVDLSKVCGWIDGMLKGHKPKTQASKEPLRVHIQIKDPEDNDSESKTVYGEELKTVLGWIDKLLESKVGSATK